MFSPVVADRGRQGMYSLLVMSEPRITELVRPVWATSIARVEQASWDALTQSAKTPFLDWHWLHLLESSGSVSTENGWQPYHLTLWSGERLQAAAPMYIKSSSRGEFVFDQIWAEVATRLGVRYYPKLLGMSPFTPTGSYSFLIDPAADRAMLTSRLVREIECLCLGHGLSGSHFLFTDPGWTGEMEGHGYTTWVHQGYEWVNQGYQSFDDFLAGFRASQRRNMRRERRSLREAGVSIRTLQGKDISPELMHTMYTLYVKHNEQFGPWSCKYLNREFFLGLLEQFQEHILLVVAERGGRDGKVVGMSLLVFKGDRLYGRYWGCFEEVAFLHFEACYYTPIEWAIRHGVTRFDPGVGGFHKTRRGFRAVPCYSLHRLFDPRMKMIMEAHMDEINALETGHIQELNELLPLSRGS